MAPFLTAKTLFLAAHWLPFRLPFPPVPNAEFVVLVEPIRNSGTTAMNVSNYQTGFELEHRDAAFAFAGMALLTSRSVVVPNRRV